MINTFAPRALFGAFLLLASACADGSEQCLGSAVACTERAPASCTDGCAMFQGCNGGAVTCDSITDDGQILCNQTAGCTWVGQCQGVDGCSERSFSECEDQVGCQEVRRCFGEGTRCEGMADSQCELYPQCAISSVCGGNAIQCDNLGSTAQCNTVPGCFAADTSPAILD